MTMQAVQEFYKAGSKNQELLAKLIKNTKGPEDFIRNAVAEGKQQGFDFSYEAADQFIKNMQGAVARQTAGGELSDIEFELVAGGKITPPPDFQLPSGRGKPIETSTGHFNPDRWQSMIQAINGLMIATGAGVSQGGGGSPNLLLAIISKI